MAVSALLLIAILVVSFLWYRDQQRAELERRAAPVSRLIVQKAATVGIGSFERENEAEMRAELVARACEEAPDYAVDAFEDIVGKDCEDASFSVEITENPEGSPDCEGDLCDFLVFSDSWYAVTIE